MKNLSSAIVGGVVGSIFTVVSLLGVSAYTVGHANFPAQAEPSVYVLVTSHGYPTKVDCHTDEYGQFLVGHIHYDHGSPFHNAIEAEQKTSNDPSFSWDMQRPLGRVATFSRDTRVGNVLAGEKIAAACLSRKA